MNPLKIEVTEAMREAGLRAYSPDISEGDYIEAALTAAFQHPEFVRQIREQVLSAVPPEEMDGHNDYYASGWYRAIERTRASLGRLLGEAK